MKSKLSSVEASLVADEAGHEPAKRLGSGTNGKGTAYSRAEHVLGEVTARVKLVPLPLADAGQVLYGSREINIPTLSQKTRQGWGNLTACLADD